MIIKKIFILSRKKIFLTDEKDVLYIYQNCKLYPFSKIFPNIVDIIYTDNFIFARSEENIYIINYNEFITGLVESFKMYISSSPIVDMGYCKKDKTLCVINNIELIFYTKYSESDFFEFKRRKKRDSTEIVKFIKGTMIAGQKDHVFIFFQLFDDDRFICEFDLDSEHMRNIVNVKNSNLILKNKDYVDYQGNYHETDIKIYCDKHILFYRNANNNYYFYIRYDNFCNLNFASKLRNLSNYISIINFYIFKNNEIIFWDKLPIKDETIICFIIKFKDNVLTEHNANIIIADKDYAYVFNDDIIKIKYQVCYDMIHRCKKMYISKEINIDIDISTSVLEQLFKIIPNLYRLNHKRKFNFNYIKNDVIISQNINNIVFDNLRADLEKVFSDTSQDYNYYNVGNLLYFANVEYCCKFLNIHPYFFYGLKKNISFITENDIYFLIKKFKDNRTLKQYYIFDNEPSLLAKLNMDIDNIDNYIKYLFTCDLTEIQIANYDEIIRGYTRYLEKHLFFQIFNTLSVNAFFDQFIFGKKYKPRFEYYCKKGSVSKFSKIFNMCFNKLSHHKKQSIVKAITGNIQNINHIAIYFEDFNKKLNYKIDTCNDRMYIYFNPTINKIRRLLYYLIIEDTIKD